MFRYKLWIITSTLSLQIFLPIALNLSETDEPNELKLCHSTVNLIPSFLATVANAFSIPSWLVPEVSVPAYFANVYSSYLSIPNLAKTCLTEWTPQKYSVHWPNLLHPSPTQWGDEIYGFEQVSSARNFEGVCFSDVKATLILWTFSYVFSVFSINSFVKITLL